MKVTFLKPGKYKSGIPVLVVSEEDVEAKKVFNVFDTNALEFIRAKRAEEYVEPKAVEPPATGDFETDMSKWTVKELMEFAAGHDPVIDLGDSKKKDEILAVIVKAIIEPPATGE